MTNLQIVVVGGGAAGFFGAIACAEANPLAQVTLLEAGREPLAKVRISGGGRCNVTHSCFEPSALVQHYPRGSRALRGPFSRFQPTDTIAWFQRRGVVLKTEADGRMFPTTDDAATIVDCLYDAARNAGVHLYTGTPVTAIAAEQPGFSVQLKAGKSLHGDRLLLATGSSPQGYRMATALGHTVVPPVPSLFTFNIADTALQGLAGIAVDPVQATLVVPDAKPLNQTGPLLITHWGVSGPAILKLSAWGARSLHDHHYHADLILNWLPHLNPEQLRQRLMAEKAEAGKRAIATLSPVPLPRRLWQYLVERAKIAPDSRWAELSKAAMQALIQELNRGQYAIQGKGVFKDEFVTCGGVSLNEVDFKTLHSKRCPGLYLAGEILDIDGVTGGFNFQSAWTTGWIAGRAMGEG